MRVLQVIDSYSFGGAERLLATLNGVAPAAGLEMTAASLSPYTVERTASLPLLEAAGLQPSFIGVRKLLDPSGIRKIVAAIRASGCDVVHAHLGTSTTLVPIAAKIAKVPCVSTLHHLPRHKEQLSAKVKDHLHIRCGERGHALVFVSDAARNAARRIYGKPLGNWITLHNGVDLSAFRPPAGPGRDELPAELGIAPGTPVVTIVAALRQPKGHEVALRAWPAVREAVPGATLLIVGDGPHRATLEGLAGEGVVFTGAREDVPALLRGSTLALLPSLTEALPTSLIESAATGLPAVATTVGGTPEVIEHGSTGTLVEPNDAAALSAAVVELLGDSDRRELYGLAARRLAEERFDLLGWAGRLSDLYDTALRTSRTRVIRQHPEHRGVT
ncbi:glycosyltransferase family 4 protein [Actinomycetes bacterium KLBMP 9759]